MKAMKNILVPVDFSRNSKNALKYAKAVAECFNANISILHAYRLIADKKIIPTSEVRDFKKQLEKSIHRKFKQIRSGLMSDAQIDVDFVTLVGFTEDTIEAYLNSKAVDLIVMGTSGDSSEEKIIGSTLSAVIKSVQIPLLAIPNNIRFRNWEKIILTKDLREDSSRSGIVPGMIKKFNSESAWVELEEDFQKPLISEKSKWQWADLCALSHSEFSLLENKLKHQNMAKARKDLSIPLLITATNN